MISDSRDVLGDRIRAIFADACTAHAAAARQSVPGIGAAVDAIRTALAGGAKVLVFGNGGSAADAQHVAAELVGRFRLNRRALPAVALTTDTSVITSIANDFAFDEVFRRQVQALGRAGDVALAITTSGRSPNVLNGLAQARRQQLTTIALVGANAGDVASLADITIAVPSENTARIQEVQRTILHIVCELVEEHFNEAPKTA